MALNLDARRRAMLEAMGITRWSRTDVEALRAGRATRRASVQPVAAPAESPVVPAAPRRARPVAAPPVTARSPASSTVNPNVTLEPLPASIETMDWAALEAAVAACRACGLCVGRTRTVFGTGSRHADWLVVGEGPGANEDRLGKPFVGQAGKLLDNMLAAIGLSRYAGLDADDAERGTRGGAADAAGLQGVYIANAVKCRPPGNRNPKPDELRACGHYLKRQVALLQPRIILAMGRFAVQALLDSTAPIGRLRGRVHAYEGVPVIVTYHPAYLLRAPVAKAKAWQDLCLALETHGAAAARAGA